MKVDAFLQLHLECNWSETGLKQANKSDDMHLIEIFSAFFFYIYLLKCTLLRRMKEAILTL